MKRTAVEAAETRAAVIDAALWVFAEQGWDGTRIEDIARRAGVTRGAVYHHSTGKGDLLTKVLKEYWASAVSSTLDRLSEPEEDPQHRIADFLAEYLTMLTEDPRFRALVVVTVEVAPHLSDDHEGMADKREALHSWAKALHTAFTAIADPLPSGLSVTEAVHSVMAVIYGATSLTSASVATPILRPAVVASALIQGIVHGSPENP